MKVTNQTGKVRFHFEIIFFFSLKMFGNSLHCYRKTQQIQTPHFLL